MKESDQKLFQWIRENIYVAVVCDVLDGLGYRDQAMHQRLRPLDSENCVIVGRARTFRWMETDYIVHEDPYGLELDAMDSLGEGDVVVHSTDFAGSNAPWGELMSTVAMVRGSAGCICDSQIRDCKKIMKLGYPVFHRFADLESAVDECRTFLGPLWDEEKGTAWLEANLRRDGEGMLVYEGGEAVSGVLHWKPRS